MLIFVEMFIISDHIERLLRSNNRVIVPGLGTFSRRYCSAVISPTGIIPPKNRIEFDATEGVNDGMLVRVLMKERKIGYQEAFWLITEETDRIHEELHTTGSEIEFGALGRFRQNGQQIEFTEKENEALNIDYFGWSPVKLRPIDSETSNPERTIEPITAGPEIPQEEPVRIPIRHIGFRRIAAAIVAIILLMSISEPISHTQRHTDYAQILGTDRIVQTTIEEDDAQTTDTEQLSETETASDTIQAIANEPTVPNGKRYAVIVASLPNKASAEAQLNHFGKKGYDRLQIVEKNDKFRIAYAVCPDKEEADRTIEQLKSSHSIFKDAWVLPIK